MLLVALGAGALVGGVPVLVVVGMVVASLLPPAVTVGVVLALAAASVVRHMISRSATVPSEGELLRQIAGRVSAGATIRTTIADSAIIAIPESARRRATLGMPMADVGVALSDVLPINGQALRAICSFSEHTGAAISSALVVLAERADEVTELARQKRVSLAQAKFSAVVVGIVPVAVSAGIIAFKGVPSPGGEIIVVPMIAGFALQVIGTLIVFKVASGAG
jgi:Flp pilus assembly protein TadB